MGKIAHVLGSDNLWSDSVPDIVVIFSVCFAFLLLIGLGYRISIGGKRSSMIVLPVACMSTMMPKVINGW